MTQLVGPVAVVLSRFPTVTETFILREMVELDRLGVPVLPWPLLRERGAPVHAEAEPWMPRALFTPFLDLELARGLASALRRRPLRTLGGFGRALWISRGSANAFRGTLGILAKCAWAAEAMRERGLRHVHAHFATHPAMAAWLASRLGEGELPFSVTVHAHDIFVTHAGLEAKLGEAAFVRCISEFNVDYLRRLFDGRPAARVDMPVIHCGIEPERYHREPRPGRPGTGRGAELLCIASHRPYKGLTHLIEAMRLLHERGIEARLTVLGDGPLRPQLERQVAAAGLEDRVDLAGTCSQEEVARRLSACDLFVLPSIVADDGQMEGIPVALMEALASRVPVVATSLSGIPELVRDGETGWLVEPADPQALAGAIEEALADPEQALRRARAGRELVRAEFEIRGVCRQLLERLFEHGAGWEGPPEIAAIAEAAGARTCASPPERIGVASWRRSRDARVVEIVLPEDARPAARRVVAKQHLDHERAASSANERARREHAALEALHAEGLGVPRPLGHVEEESLVLMEAVEGANLDEALRRARRAGRLEPALEEDLAAAAQLFGELERARGPEALLDGGAVARRLLAELEEDAAVAVQRGLDRGLVDALAARARPGLERPAARACWSHGDAWSGNVLVVGGGARRRLVLLDLEGLRPGRPGEDAAQFLEQLALSQGSPWARARRLARSASRAFLRGLDAPPPLELRIAKALRTAAWSPMLARGEAAARRRHGRRLRALGAEHGE